MTHCMDSQYFVVTEKRVYLRSQAWMSPIRASCYCQAQAFSEEPGGTLIGESGVVPGLVWFSMMGALLWSRLVVRKKRKSSLDDAKINYAAFRARKKRQRAFS
ncbi:unnamed protein product [Prunus armeniaca]|uniref:Uncharacterized protein n=1 Tax=Prunus armeniaca TaxID=36596 RepID=A0A6J5VXZ0_PRUAR|nr:unnamed protein product [Prunus armeniaca]CAB4294046.1 unnamed protein product [Prunus armeniaca]